MAAFAKKLVAGKKTPQKKAPARKRLEPSEFSGASSTRLLAELRLYFSAKIPVSPFAFPSLCKEWIGRGRTLAEASSGPRSIPVWERMLAVDPSTANKLAKLGHLTFKDSALSRMIAKPSDPNLLPSADLVARGFARLLLESGCTRASERSARSAIVRARYFLKNDAHLGAQALLGAKGSIESATLSALDNPRNEKVAADVFSLAKTLCGHGVSAEIAAAKATIARQKEHGDHLSAWGAAAMAALASDSLPVLRKVVEGLLEVDPLGIEAKFLVSRTVGWRTVRERISLLTCALRAGAFACAEHLVDLGAASHLLASGHLSESDNPFCALRGGVVKAANARGLTRMAPSKMFSKIARSMANSLLAQGLTPEMAKAKVDAAAESANKRLSRSSSKAAFERLLLTQTLELADLGDDPQLAPTPKARSTQRL
jgi:hypothetical protein